MRRRYRSLALFAAAVTAIAACGGSATEGVTPPPPPPVVPHVASLTYATPSALIFTGHTVPAEALVQAFDAKGNVLSDTLLDFTLPAGWVLKHDSITAPTWESEGALSAAPKAQYAADVAFATAPANSSQVVGAINLRGYHWTWAWECADTTPRNLHLGDRVDSTTMQYIYIDSIAAFNAVPDTIFYQSDTSAQQANPGYIRNWGGVAQVTLTGSRIWYYRDGVADTLVGAQWVAVIPGQAPDSIGMPERGMSSGYVSTFAIRQTGADSLRWIGGNMCGPSGDWERYTPVTMVASH